MKKFTGWFAMLATALLAASPAVYPQARLVQTIDLNAWAGAPVPIAQIPPQPAPAFSLTGIVLNPVTNTLYASDYGTTNVYAIDGATNQVVSAVYTNGITPITADIGPTQDLPGTAPTSILVNPVTNRWIFMGKAVERSLAERPLSKASSRERCNQAGRGTPPPGRCTPRTACGSSRSAILSFYMPDIRARAGAMLWP